MNKPGKIIIIEGIWGAGKTTLIKSAAKKINSACLREPSHLKAGISFKDATSATRWYFKAHERNLKRAYVLARGGKNVLMERSSLSSTVFSKVFLNRKNDVGMRHFESYIKKFHNHGVNIYLIYLKPRKINVTAAIIKRKPYLRAYGGIKSLQSLDCQLRLVIRKIEKKNPVLVYRNPKLKSLIKLFGLNSKSQ